MEKELYQAVAYIALRQKDGSLMINVPLYVKVSEVNKNGMTETQESVMHRVSETKQQCARAACRPRVAYSITTPLCHIVTCWRQFYYIREHLI